MRARLPLARLLLSLTPCVVLLQGCAASADPAIVAPEPQRDSATVALPPLEPFRSSAPGEIVSEGVKAERDLVVGDMLRTDLVTTVEQGSPGILRAGVGERFHSHESRDYHFAQLASAYYGWTVDSDPLLIELWEGGTKIGEYADETFLIGPRYAKPRDCPETATTGLCGSQHAAGPVQPVSPDRRPAPPVARSRPAANDRQRSGFHFGLGLGGGVADLSCDGCDFPSETGFSGFLSLAGWVAENRRVGIESTGWTKSESGETARVYSVMAHVTEYLSATSGLFLSAGAGLVGYHEDTEFGDRSANALGFSGRVGYELGTGGVGFVPYVGLVRTFGGVDVKLDGEDADLNVAISNVQFGLSIAVH